MKFLRDVKLKTKLLSISAIPMVLLAFFVIYKLYGDYDKVTQYKQLDKIVEATIAISSTIHQLQKERGMTAGYLGSGGELFKDTIGSQRGLTDQKIADLQNILSKLDQSSFTKNIQENLNQGVQNLSKLSSIRTKVSDLGISTQDAVQFYTKTNRYFLDLIGTSAELSFDGKLSKNMLGYYNFLMAKERAGIERALGANIFAQKSFEKGIYKKFTETVSTQESYLAQFTLLGTQKQIEFYNSKVATQVVNDVAQMRTMLLDQNNFESTPSVWFDKMTQKINTLKQIDDFISSSIKNYITSKIDQLNFSMYLISSILLVIFTVLSFMTYFIFKDIFNSIKKIENGIFNFMKYLAREQNIYQEIDLEGTDELGQVAALMNKEGYKTNENIETDMLSTGETIISLNKMIDGDLQCRIKTESPTPQVNTFITLVNQTLDKQTGLYDDILMVLREYINYNYTKTIKTDGLSGVYKELVEGINTLRDSIVEMLNENKHTGEALLQNSAILLQNVETLNANSNQAAASLEETAAAVEEITGNINSSVNNVMQMTSTSNELKDSSIEGQKLATQTTSSMDEINNQVNTISEAIAVIDQIAFQTNILSLNAAVEAATAGEAGKGFAVVAQEVRNLASRSAVAANDIKQIVQDASQKALSGKKIADEMIGGYEQLTHKLNETIELIKSVEVASREQQTGIIQINDAINALDSQTQQNANIASQTNSVANKTDSIANEITQKVSQKTF